MLSAAARINTCGRHRGKLEGGLGEGFSLGHTPSTAGTFQKKFQKNSGKTPETLSERFLEFPSRVRLGSPRVYNSRHLKASEHFKNSLPPPPVRLGCHGNPSSTGGISDSCELLYIYVKFRGLSPWMHTSDVLIPESWFVVRSNSNRHRCAAVSNRTIRITRPKTVRIAVKALLF